MWYTFKKKGVYSMQEIQLPNDLQLKVYINGVPNLAVMSKELPDGFYSVIQILAEKFVQDNSLAE